MYEPKAGAGLSECEGTLGENVQLWQSLGGRKNSLASLSAQSVGFLGFGVEGRAKVLCLLSEMLLSNTVF